MLFKLRKMIPSDVNYITKTLSHCWAQSSHNDDKKLSDFNEKLQKAMTCKCIVLCHSDKPDIIVGFTLYKPMSDVTAALFAVYVRETWRQTGLATRMLNFLAKRGYDTVALYWHLKDEDLLATRLGETFNIIDRRSVNVGH